MKELFTYLCDFSIVTSIVIFLAILLRPVLKKGPAFLRSILWTLVFLRLLVPVGLAELHVPAFNLFDTAEEAVSTPDYAEDPAMGDHTVQNPVQDPVGQTPDVQTPGTQAPDAETPDVQAPDVQVPDVQSPVSGTVSVPGGAVTAPAADPTAPQEQIVPQPEKEIDVLMIVSAVWAAGVIAMIGYMLASNLLLCYRVRDAIVYDGRVRVISKDCSPFVFGIFRPLIYIPASANKEDWQHIIAHESCHIKRLDHVLKPLAFLVLCFYWFNPLVWAAYLLLSKDIEYACDERTVKSMESKDRKAYSLALLAVSQGEKIVFAPPLSFGRVSVKERIKRVMNRKIPVWAVCITLLICISLVFLTVFTLAEGEKPDVDGSEQSSEEPNTSRDESDMILDIFVSYANPAELKDAALFFEDAESMKTELIKVWVNQEVRNFKFIEVLYDDDTNPYAGKTLFEVALLAPDTPFYARTYIPEGFCNRGVSFENEKGETVYCDIFYDSRDGELSDSPLRLGNIPALPASSEGNPSNGTGGTGSDPSNPFGTVSDHILDLPKNVFEGGEPIAQIGEWVYYANNNQTINNLLWGRVRLDGSVRQRYESDGIRSPLVTEDRIYYIDSNDGNHLYAMRHDGTGVTLLCEDDVCALDGLVNGRIYYHVADEPVEKYDPENDESYIDWGEERYYSIKTDGTEKQQRAVSGLPAPDGWVYTWADYSEYRGYADRRIHKMRPDGSGDMLLTAAEVEDFVVRDGWVYYTLLEGETGLFRVRTDGTVTEKLCNDVVYIYSIAFDETNIYYIRCGNRSNLRESGELYTIKQDGTGRRKLSEFVASGLHYGRLQTHLLAANGTVFFVATDSAALYAVKADGTDERLIDNSTQGALTTESGFFYQRNDRYFFYRFSE